MGTLRLMLILALVALPLGGCRPTETDVTHSPRYDFSTFAGTGWRTKVKLALADVKEYTGAHHLYLLPPFEFEPTSPRYSPPVDSHIVRVLPAGTRIRIGRLMFDNGEGSLLWVTASLDDGLGPERIVYVSEMLLARNRWIPGPGPVGERRPGSDTSMTWGVNPKYLESAAPPRK